MYIWPHSQNFNSVAVKPAEKQHFESWTWNKWLLNVVQQGHMLWVLSLLSNCLLAFYYMNGSELSVKILCITTLTFEQTYF